MSNYGNTVHIYRHVQPGNIWYCPAAFNHRANIYNRCCEHTFPNNHYITATSKILCYRCQRLYLRAQERR